MFKVCSVKKKIHCSFSDCLKKKSLCCFKAVSRTEGGDGFMNTNFTSRPVRYECLQGWRVTRPHRSLLHRQRHKPGWRFRVQFKDTTWIWCLLKRPVSFCPMQEKTNLPTRPRENNVNVLDAVWQQRGCVFSSHRKVLLDLHERDELLQTSLRASNQFETVSRFFLSHASTCSYKLKLKWVSAEHAGPKTLKSKHTLHTDVMSNIFIKGCLGSKSFKTNLVFVFHAVFTDLQLDLKDVRVLICWKPSEDDVWTLQHCCSLHEE